MAAACFAGLLYFALIFSFAFAMGVVRTLVVAPWLGSTAAVLLELPIVIGASWVVAHRLLRNRSFTLSRRATMGATAFVLTMASEITLSFILRGQNIADWAASVTTLLGFAGMASQIAFAAMPMFIRLERPETGRTA